MKMLSNGIVLNNEFISFEEMKNINPAKLQSTFIQIVNERGGKLVTSIDYIKEIQKYDYDKLKKFILYLADFEVD